MLGEQDNTNNGQRQTANGSNYEEKTMILAGDLGGTKTILALISAEGEPREPLVETRFNSRNYNSLLDIIQDFVEQNVERLVSDPLVAAAFGVAGPIIDGVANITNLDWRFSRASIAKLLALPEERVSLLNDLEALATAVPYLGATDVHVLNEGVKVAERPIAIIAPGTGLGQAFLLWDGQRYQAHASEGGHTGFTPGTPRQVDLLNYLFKKHHHVSMERVCSGLGIPNIYNFLRDEKQAEEPDWLREEMDRAADVTPIILNNGISEQAEPICRQTLELFISALGTQASNLALTILARGGVYVGGGIPPRILNLLHDPLFLESFQNKGRFRSMMEETPVSVIMNSKAPLLGAGYAALAAASEL